MFVTSRHTMTNNYLLRIQLVSSIAVFLALVGLLLYQPSRQILCDGTSTTIKQASTSGEDNKILHSKLARVTKELHATQETLQRLNRSRNEHENKPETVQPVQFKDVERHEDDDELSRALYDQVRVLCWVMTSHANLYTRAVHVNATWGPRCNTLLFVSDTDEPDFPAKGFGTEKGRAYLTAKSIRAFDYIYQNHFDDADWFMKVDDDSYVIMENLRYLLSPLSPSEPHYLGHPFKAIVKHGYHSGGAGYVLSKEALRRFAKRAPIKCNEKADAEDVEIARCLWLLGVSPVNTWDVLGRTRFHCLPLEPHITGEYPGWYKGWDINNATYKGIDSVSDYPVSFHYVKPEQMYVMEYIVYHLAVYGIRRGFQDLNAPVNRNISELFR